VLTYIHHKGFCVLQVPIWTRLLPCYSRLGQCDVLATLQYRLGYVMPTKACHTLHRNIIRRTALCCGIPCGCALHTQASQLAASETHSDGQLLLHRLRYYRVRRKQYGLWSLVIADRVVQTWWSSWRQNAWHTFLVTK